MRIPFTVTSSARQGFSLVEVFVVFTIVLIALSMFARTLVSSKKLDPIATETTIAASAARTMLEKMKNHPFEDVFALYNDVPGDDPDGAGTGPGSQFDVEGLTPLTPGGHCGTIVFPAKNGALREDLEDQNLGMPRDLNADGIIDALNHGGDCVVLPIRIRIEWVLHGSKDTHRWFEMYTMFGRY